MSIKSTVPLAEAVTRHCSPSTQSKCFDATLDAMQLTILLCTQLRFLMQAQAHGMGNTLEPDQALLSSNPNSSGSSCTSSTSSSSEVNSGPDENHYQHCSNAASMEPAFDGFTSFSQSSNAAVNARGTSMDSRVSLRLEGNNHQHSSNDRSMEDPSSDGLVSSSQTSGTEANMDVISVNHEVSLRVGVKDEQQSDNASSMESSSDGLTSSPDGLTSSSDGRTSFSPAPTAGGTSSYMQFTCSQASAEEASTSPQSSSSQIHATKGKSSSQVAWVRTGDLAVQPTSQTLCSQASVGKARSSSATLDSTASFTEANSSTQPAWRLGGVASILSSSSQVTGSQASVSEVSISSQTAGSQGGVKASSQPTCSHAAVRDASSQTVCSQNSARPASSSSQTFGKRDALQSAHLDRQQAASRNESLCKKVWQCCKLPQAVKAAQHMLLHFLRLLPVTHPSPPTGQSDCDSPDSDKLETQPLVPSDTVQLCPSAADDLQADALLHAAPDAVSEQDTAARGGDAVQLRHSPR